VQQTGSTKSTNRAIAAMVSRLLSHYWTAADPVETREAQIEDWIIDLREFGPDIVNEACARWRIANDRRPTPANVRLLAIDIQREENDRLALEGPDTQAIRAAREAVLARREERHSELQREGRDIVNRWAVERGYDDIDDYATAHKMSWAVAYSMVVDDIFAKSRFRAAVTPLTAAAMGVTATEARRDGLSPK